MAKQKIEITSFGLGIDPASTSAEDLGGKGAGLVYLSSLGVAVPPGFTIHTSACAAYFKSPEKTMAHIAEAVAPWLMRLGDKFGYMPLLSVRSGARQSMPGMMDTILNVGLDENTAEAWVARIGKDCVADSRRRLVEMYGSVVDGLDRAMFAGKSPAEAAMQYRVATGRAFPKASEQVTSSIEAVFKSWNNDRAKFYRQMHSIPESWGTAVTIQAMVFGNMNDYSCTGVLFTRNPDTGENVVTGEFLPNAQGEDVVAGTRTPLQLTALASWDPEVSAQLLTTVKTLETQRKDVQDVEFTVQDGKLFILQTRNAKRTPRAALRIGLSMLKEGLIDQPTLLKRLTFSEFMAAQGTTIAPGFTTAPVATGIPACSGIVTGTVVGTSESAVAATGPVVLVTHETTPDDIAGMKAAVGVLTMTGGATSHAAVVARSMNRACVVGLGGDLAEFPVGSTVSIDGATGRVWKCEVPVVTGVNGDVGELLSMLVAGENLITDDGTSAMLDLSRFHGRAAEAVATVTKALAKFPSVIVDTRAGLNEAHKLFGTMFGNEGEADLLRALADLLDDKNWHGRVMFVASDGVSVPSSLTGHVVANVTTAEALVTTKLPMFTVAVQNAPEWLTKLVSWKKQMDNSEVLELGVVGGTGKCYASALQVAQHKLG